MSSGAAPAGRPAGQPGDGGERGAGSGEREGAGMCREVLGGKERGREGIVVLFGCTTRSPSTALRSKLSACLASATMKTCEGHTLDHL